MPTWPNTAALGGGHPGVAGADDLGDGSDGLGAIGEGGHGLRPADAVDFGDAGALGGGQHQGFDMAVGGRHDHHYARTPATFAGATFISTDEG